VKGRRGRAATHCESRINCERLGVFRIWNFGLRILMGDCVASTHGLAYTGAGTEKVPWFSSTEFTL
jgi:hypothetical protein